MGGRGFESRQKRPKLKDENICILGDASFSHKKSIPDQKGARSSASISRVCPGRVGADPGTHHHAPRCVSVCVDLLFFRQLVTSTWFYASLRRQEKSDVTRLH